MKQFIPLSPLVAAMCACAIQPVRYAPTGAPTQQLPTAKLPTLLLEDVVDATGGGEFIHDRAPWNGGMAGLILEWDDIVHNALVLELQRLGWPTTTNRTLAGARLKATATQVQADWNGAGFSLPVKGRVVVALVLKGDDGRELWTGQLEGVGHGTISMGGAPAEDVRDTLSAALASAMTGLGPLLADEHPWDLLGHGRDTPASPAAPAPIPVPTPAPTPAAMAAPPIARVPLAGRLAVLELKNLSKDVSADDARYFTDLVRAAVLKFAPQLDVMTRENLLVLLKSSSQDLANCEGECEVETGRRIGADEIISGEIQKVGTRYKISLRLHETHEGRLAGASVASGKSIDELDDSASKAVSQLFDATR